MYKLVALYKMPSDKEKFDQHYSDVHTPITLKIPKMKEMRVSKVFGSPTGKSDYYLQAELCFDSESDFNEAMKSREAKDSGKDLMGFAGDIVNVYFVKEDAQVLS